MQATYLSLMEMCLSAYSNAHIREYFDRVKREGLTEHGFPRLAANIGILIAHGKRRDLLPLFREMMAFCCREIPRVKAANDFSVREIVACIEEIERAEVLPADELARLKEDISTIEPTSCYTKFARDPADPVRNWALFTGVSEYKRLSSGLGGDMDFIETQIASQLKWLDENGMYRDNARCDERYQPIVYDIVPRGLFCLLLHYGYRGKYYEQISESIKKTALLDLAMQSPNGEIPFGGRSNQFLHNEAWLAAIFEFEANRYQREGNAIMALRFKAGIKRALAVTEAWLKKTPIRHIKNRFPTETKYGCENYAYFDKYMITAASNLYAAYSMCDPAIPYPDEKDTFPAVFATSSYFHKVFLKSGGYGIELDTHADPHYDAKGLGRVHRAGAPSCICMSVPCPAYGGLYKTDREEAKPLAICAGVKQNGEWLFATGEKSEYSLLSLTKSGAAAHAVISCLFEGGATVETRYDVDKDGVTLTLSGEGELACLLPAFHFDGEGYTEIASEGGTLSVRYEGWVCRYTAEGEILPLDRMGANRNGYYKAFFAAGEGSLRVKIEILPL